MAAHDIWVGEAPIDPAALHAAFLAAHGGAGAAAAFTGTVRDAAADGAVERLWLDWYPGMTEASVAAIANVFNDSSAIPALAGAKNAEEVWAIVGENE